MKKYLLGILCVCCVILTLPAAFSAEADAPPSDEIAALLAANVGGGPCGAENPDDLYWILDEDGVMTFVGSGAMADYSGDRMYENYYCTTAPWFQYRKQIKSVVIPQGVTRIGAYAFYGRPSHNNNSFTELTSVTIAESVTSIGASAFLDCDALTEVSVPGNVTEIGEAAFAQNDALSAVTLCEGLVSIGKSAFYNCPKLASMTIPLSVTSIGESAFSECSALTLNVYQGSEGWKYALQNGVKSEVIQEPTKASYALSILNAQIFPAGATHYDASAPSATSAKTGEIVVLTVGFQNKSASDVQIAAFMAELNYDTEKLEIYRLFLGDSPYQKGGDFSKNWTFGGNAKENFVNFGGFANADAVTVAANSDAVIARFAFRVKSGATDGETQFVFDADKSYVVNDAGEKFALDDFEVFRLSVSCAPPMPKYALEAIAFGKETVSVYVTNLSGAGGVLVIAAYSESGKFLYYALEMIEESRIAPGNSESVTVLLDAFGAKTIRAMMMDPESSKPISQPFVVTV